MKKKGLIISTVVMVVVLVASLTTATFAWFTTTASAAIDELEVKTQAAKGLEIALFTPGNSSTYTSGNAKLNLHNWAGENTTWGPSISFENKASDTQIEYMAVSGNGKTMYKLADGAAFNADGSVGTGAELEAVENANEHYFMAYVALKNTDSANTNALEITSLSVTATQNANQLTGMAASLRIAVFGVKGTQASAGDAPSGPYNQAPPDFDASTNLIAVYAPFGNISYVSGAWTTQHDSTNKENSYVSAPHESDNLYAGSTKAKFDALKFKTIDATSTEAAPSTVEGKNLALNTGSIELNDIYYMMIVIWFEGEDAECSNYFAGGGAQISFTFGKVAA